MSLDGSEQENKAWFSIRNFPRFSNATHADFFLAKIREKNALFQLFPLVLSYSFLSHGINRIS